VRQCAAVVGSAAGIEQAAVLLLSSVANRPFVAEKQRGMAENICHDRGTA